MIAPQAASSSTPAESALPNADAALNAAASTTADSTTAASTTGKTVEADKAAFWGVFLSTFITIFLAEVGDKTQMATLLLSAQSQAPLSVFLGAGLALVCTSLIGVLLGQWLSKRVSAETLDICAGILLLLITIGLVGDIVGS